VVLQTPRTPISANATGYNYRTLAAIETDKLPETTTYTEDVGGNTIHPTTGSFAWCENYSLPAYDQTYTGNAVLKSDGNIIVNDGPLLCVWDFSESTGALLWTSTPYNNDFSFQSSSVGTLANGILYVPGYDGYMHAINATTGVQVWQTISRAGGTEMPQPAYPMSSDTIAGPAGDTVVYASTTKSYEAVPLYRGHCLYAYNGETGAQIWNISGEFSIYCVDDGILIGANNYDNTIYAFGMGPSATTVTAPQTSVAAGTNCIIQGTVTDQTPGLLKGTPAISDAYMGAWMEYMYMDQAFPTQATGVNVVLTAIDPNHNLITIGNATSDISGTFGYQWTPPDVSGKYTIIATFNADNSYYASSGETIMTVGSPAAASPAPTSTPTSVADMYFIPVAAGLFVLIIVVAIVLALLMLRKRP
jgi:outer membrane protein assembly factor BamB